MYVGEALTMAAIAKKQVDIAVDEGTIELSHGAKGKASHRFVLS